MFVLYVHLIKVKSQLPNVNMSKSVEQCMLLFKVQVLKSQSICFFHVKNSDKPENAMRSIFCEG